MPYRGISVYFINISRVVFNCEVLWGALLKYIVFVLSRLWDRCSGCFYFVFATIALWPVRAVMALAVLGEYRNKLLCLSSLNASFSVLFTVMHSVHMAINMLNAFNHTSLVAFRTLFWVNFFMICCNMIHTYISMYSFLVILCLHIFIYVAFFIILTCYWFLHYIFSIFCVIMLECLCDIYPAYLLNLKW